MARYQYRVAGRFDWMSNSGNAIIALANKPGSGKKVTIRSVELTNLTFGDNVTAGTPSSSLPIILRVARDCVLGAGGTEVPIEKLDSDAAAWPSTVVVSTNRGVTTAGAVLGRATVAKQFNTTGIGYWASSSIVHRLGGSRTGPKRNASTPVEQYTISAGQSLAVYTNTGITMPLPVRVQATLSRSGTPDRTYVVNFFTVVYINNDAVLSIENTAGSGETIKLINFSVTEVGTYDSPYLQFVPFGSIDAVSVDDSAAQVAQDKVDSANPSASTWVAVYKDVAVLPYGLPESALSDASAAGIPKGSNYLKAKDFIGPQYRVYFPENVSVSSIRMPDAIGYGIGHKNSDIGVRRSGIVLREGESVGIVSAAETAAAATAAGISGWSSWHIAIQYDIEPKYAPTLTISGLKNPSEVRIFDAGTTTEIAGEENITDGTFTWQFDPEEYPSVDISIISLNYQNIRLLGQSLTLADLTIPVQQQIDRQYGNL
jgi:hypothetical protein